VKLEYFLKIGYQGGCWISRCCL